MTTEGDGRGLTDWDDWETTAVGPGPYGRLTEKLTGCLLMLRVCPSGEAFCIGTAGETGLVRRESVETWPTREAAASALAAGRKAWTQRDIP